MREIEDMEAGTYDIHTDNQTRLLKLGEHPKGRTLAKNFVYQMIFQDIFGDQGINAAGFGFSGKADFMSAFEGTQKERVAYWTGVSQAFFDKYQGLYEHSKDSIRIGISVGRIYVPSGRFYVFSPAPNKYNGELDWPRTKILNYPVQGFSADLVQVARITLAERLGLLDRQPSSVWAGKRLLINTVHDDIELDVDNNPELLYNTCIEMEKAFRDIPSQFKKMYGSEINVPMAGEVKYGMNLNESSMKKFKAKTFEQDYKNYIQEWQLKHSN